MSTIFSKIITGELPCHKIYEDEHVLAFLDINPIQPGHTLVIPKSPSEDGVSCPPEDMARIVIIGQKIAVAVMEATQCDGINFLMNNGAAAGQKVFHTHLHIIPRFNEDGVYEEPTPGEYKSGEADLLSKRLQSTMKAEMPLW
jgi:histidine triad (HIT) family protein